MCVCVCSVVLEMSAFSFIVNYPFKQRYRVSHVFLISCSLSDCKCEKGMCSLVAERTEWPFTPQQEKEGQGR